MTTTPLVLLIVRPYDTVDEYLAAEAWTIDARAMLLVDAPDLEPDTAACRHAQHAHEHGSRGPSDRAAPSQACFCSAMTGQGVTDAPQPAQPSPAAPAIASSVEHAVTPADPIDQPSRGAHPPEPPPPIQA